MYLLISKRSNTRAGSTSEHTTYTSGLQQHLSAVYFTSGMGRQHIRRLTCRLCISFPTICVFRTSVQHEPAQALPPVLLNFQDSCHIFKRRSFIMMTHWLTFPLFNTSLRISQAIQYNVVWYITTCLYSRYKNRSSSSS